MPTRINSVFWRLSVAPPPPDPEQALPRPLLLRPPLLIRIPSTASGASAYSQGSYRSEDWPVAELPSWQRPISKMRMYWEIGLDKLKGWTCRKGG